MLFRILFVIGFKVRDNIIIELKLYQHVDCVVDKNDIWNVAR